MKNLFKNEILKKVLLFFNENPNCIDTVKGISVWIGCPINSVQKALDKLVEEKILINHKALSMDAYSYTTDRHIVKKVEEYIKKNIT